MTANTTWNPSDKTANITLSNGNLTAAGTNSSDGGVRGTTSKSAGLVYFEILLGGTVAGGDTGVGICTGAATLTAVANTASAAAILYLITPGIWFNGSFSAATGFTNFVATDVVQVAINFTTSRMWWRKNDTGSWYGGTGTPGDPAAGTNGLNISALFPGSAAFPVFTANSSTPTGTIRLSQAQFSFSPPSGFSPWDAAVRRNEAMIIG